MAYSSVFKGFDEGTPGAYDGLSTSWEGQSSLHRLSEDDIGYAANRTPSGDTSTHMLIHQPSHSTLSLHDSSYASGKYVAVDHVTEEPSMPAGEGFSFGLSRLRRGRVGAATQRSQQSSIFQGQLAVGKAGWWKRQMLVDRSLRSMAALMSLFALAIIIIVAAYARDFGTRANKNSTSVGSQEPESCGTMEARDVIIHLIINISATMILGMSNTYQQLVTSLNVDEIRHVLSKKGDSRVGTNSPFAINDKKSGKLKHWLAWILLIMTSLPVHFLANSLVGPSLYVEPPQNVIYTPTADDHSTIFESGSNDLACWTAFRSGQYHFPRDFNDMLVSDAFEETITYSTVNITYTRNCTTYLNNSSPTKDYSKEILVNAYGALGLPGCRLGDQISCFLEDPQGPKCRLNVRYQAALILAACLSIKAIYMVVVNLRARQRVKRNCLTFGDVIVASALDPTLQVRNECLVNAGDGYRHLVAHTCHKHCTDATPSDTGDSIGHCQKCKKFNPADKAANLVHPVLAIKYKKSLISNLGTTAVTQMILLMFASLIMLALSLMFAVLMATKGEYFDKQCRSPPAQRDPDFTAECASGKAAYLKENYGSWGGFNSSVVIAQLSSDSIAAEQVAFWISNGAQLLYSLLYLLLIYNITLISMEHDWGKFEQTRKRLRCTIVRGNVFEQSYLLQLPEKVLFPMMGFSALMHWLLGQAISTRETIWSDHVAHTEHSQYEVVTASYPVFLSTTLMIGMTGVLWWAFTFKREGFMPQMYGSIRACCSSSTDLDDFPLEGVQWGDLGNGEKFRHAGFSAGEVREVVPAELYCGGERRKEKGREKGD